VLEGLFDIVGGGLLAGELGKLQILCTRRDFARLLRSVPQSIPRKS